MVLLLSGWLEYGEREGHESEEGLLAEPGTERLGRADAHDLEAEWGYLADALDGVFVVLGCGVCTAATVPVIVARS